MNQNLDDPKLTAYALGEMDETERAEMEARVALDPEAAAFIAETRAFATSLEAELKRAPQPDITTEQKSAIAAEAQGKIIHVLWGRVWMAAACLAFFGFVLYGVTVSRSFRTLGSSGIADPRGLSETSPRNDQLVVLADKAGEAKKEMAESLKKSKSGIDDEVAASTSLTAGESSDVAEQKSEHSLSSSSLESPTGNRQEIAQAAPIKAPAPVAEATPATATTAPATPQAWDMFGATDADRTKTEIAKAQPAPGQPLFSTSPNGNKQFEGYINHGSPIASTKPTAGLPAAMAGRTGSTRERVAGSATLAANGVPALAKSRGEYADTRASSGQGQALYQIDKAWDAPVEKAPGADQPGGLSTDGFNTEAYDHITDNPFLRAAQNSLSTFSIDVDTASYANVRRFLTSNTLPPKDAVRIEELVNYFTYEYPQPKSEEPFSVNVEVAPAPWNSAHQLARIGLKGREVPPAERTACNLVFLLDVSGSMNEPNELPLVRESMKMLVERLRPDDRVAIVTYAGASGMALASTEVKEKAKILQAIDQLKPGGSTNGAAGIQLAYDIAKANFIKGSANRVILCTDGDFNVGVTNQGELVRLIEEKAKSGVFLTVLGFGMGNYKDSMLEKFADKGNGAYGYIDTKREAQKLFVDQLSGTLVTIAKDVKIQIEFNPAHVGAYRLIGYENRLLRAEDFNDDKKDAGEIGAGHTVTALYELVPAGHEQDVPGVDALKYRETESKPAPAGSAEWMTVKLRYKQPDGNVSKLIEQPVTPNAEAAPSKDFQFAASVAEFGMLLRESPHKGSSSFDTALELAENGMGPDTQGYRHEFIDLLRKAKELKQ